MTSPVRRVLVIIAALVTGLLAPPSRPATAQASKPATAIVASLPPTDRDLQRQLDAGIKALQDDDYEAALHLFLAGLRMARSSRNQGHTRVFLSNVGVVYEKLNRYEEAIATHRQAMVIDREMHNRRREALPKM